MKKPAEFFEKPKEHSKVKIDIVAEYFAAWSQILKRSCQTLTYLDLCSGPGKYQDGTPSTPLRILNEIQKNPSLYDCIKLYFFEGDKTLSGELIRNIDQHPVTQELRYPPKVECAKIDYESAGSLPIDDCTFTFIDPWGYKPITLDLLSVVLQNYGNDCLFYLSTAGVKRNLNIPSQESHLVRLFGTNGLEYLRSYEQNAQNPKPFHQVLIETLGSSLGSVKGAKRSYFVPFAVESNQRRQVLHYLGFLSKHRLGFEKMKNVMAKHSQQDTDGVPTFHFSGDLQMLLPLDRGLVQITDLLLTKFEGMTLLVGKLVEECHSIGLLYLSKNIKDALELLWDEGKIELVSKLKRKRRKGTFGDALMVRFPYKS